MHRNADRIIEEASKLEDGLGNQLAPIRGKFPGLISQVFHLPPSCETVLHVNK